MDIHHSEVLHSHLTPLSCCMQLFEKGGSFPKPSLPSWGAPRIPQHGWQAGFSCSPAWLLLHTGTLQGREGMCMLSNSLVSPIFPTVPLVKLL
mgnify:CR=1 FL=1